MHNVHFLSVHPWKLGAAPRPLKPSPYLYTGISKNIKTPSPPQRSGATAGSTVVSWPLKCSTRHEAGV